MVREKSCVRVLGRGFLLFAAILGVSLLFLWIRPLFAESLDLGSYNAATDAEEYRALPVAGPNFAVNSRLGYGAGRYYLKGKTAACILAAYADLERTHPEYHYLYGEMGWKGGGRIRPHRTHQQGLSADFMTPVTVAGVDRQPMHTVLPCNAANLWGYHIRLDGNGRHAEYQLDARAMIAHLEALQKNAPRYGLRIERIIFDPPLLKSLRADPDFSRIGGLPFMEGQAWFPHDGHYHVDFAGR